MSDIMADDDIAAAYMEHVPSLRHCRSENLWAICCDREDFCLRQGAYIVLKERGFDMPHLLPIEGDEMPSRRGPALRLLRGGLSP